MTSEKRRYGLNTLKGLANPFKLRPNTFIVGFQKSGTTSLYNYLVETGAFSPGHVKENDKLVSKGDYLNKFLYRFPWKWTAERTLCASHLVGFNPLGIRRLKKHFPDAKYVFIMRNPVERAFSRYQHNQRKDGNIDKKFELSFAELVDFELEILSKIDTANVDEIYNATAKINPYGLPVSRGLYKAYLKRFKELDLKVFEMHLEELQSNFDGEMKRLFGFLDIDPKVPSQHIYNQSQSTEKMDLKTKEKLTEFYTGLGYDLR